MLFSESLIQFPHFCPSMIITTKSRWDTAKVKAILNSLLMSERKSGAGQRAGCLQGRFSSLNFSDDNFE